MTSNTKNTVKLSDVNIAYFGGEPLGIPVLEELKAAGFLPKLIVCNPDRPQGRKLVLTAPPIKEWAETNDIPVFQPESLKDSEVKEKLSGYDLFIVVSYAVIIPEDILIIPKHKAINLHPSLLPKYRGPSPIRSAILENDRNVGVTIIELDEKVDHGPIIAQKEVEIPKETWPLKGRALDMTLAKEGGKLLSETIPDWVNGTLISKEQDHESATYTKKITKDMGEINLNNDPYQNYLKICAFDGWPGVFFYAEKNGRKTRVKITDAVLNSDGSLQINTVIPEGKKEVAYAAFLKNT